MSYKKNDTRKSEINDILSYKRDEARKIEIDNDYATLWFYPKHKIIHHKFHKFTKGDNFRNVLIRGAELFEQYNCKKWLSDDRDVKVVAQDDIEWGNKYWNQRIKKAGWKYWALILPENAIGKLSSKLLIENFTKLGIKVEIFSTPNQGLNWLMLQE